MAALYREPPGAARSSAGAPEPAIAARRREVAHMSKSDRPGFYRDESGSWQPDRRSGVDRRARQTDSAQYREQRKFARRKADRELYEKDHKIMIQEALDDFAEEHASE